MTKKKMSKDICIVCVAFGKQYVRQQKRLKQTIGAHCPDAHTIFWTDELPEGSRPFYESLYGFKVHAVKWAILHGYKKIVFVDPAVIFQHRPDYWFTLNLPVIAVKDDNKLNKMIGQKALNYYGNPDIIGWHLVGGSLYVFDFNHRATYSIFDHWCQAEADGIFGSQAELSSEQINGHRMDESCMAVAMYSHGVEPVGHDVARYNQNEDSVIIKKHFK